MKVFITLLLICLLIHLAQTWVQDVSYPTHFLMDTPAEIIGLKNCTYVFIQLVIYSNRKWKWVMLDRTDNSYWEINATQGNVHIDTFTDHQDQLIFTAYDRLTGQKFTQMVDLSQNIYYNYSGFPEMDFAFYNGSEDLYLVHMAYPHYQIKRGSLKNQSFLDVFEYPPLLTYSPTTNVKCSEGVCYWLMNQGPLMIYPMSSLFSSNTFHSLSEDSIILFQFAEGIDGAHLMYTGHTSGLILQWILLSDNTYKPIRLTDAFLGSQLSSLTIVGNPGDSYLAATTVTDQQIGIYLQQNKIVSQHTSILTIGSRNTTQTWNCPHPPQMAYFKRNVDIFSTLYHVQFTPDDGHIDDPSVNSLFEAVCWSKIENIEVETGVYKNEEVWFCGVGGIGLQGCEVYSMYNQSVCVKCEVGYELVEGACQLVPIVIPILIPIESNQTNSTLQDNSTQQTNSTDAQKNNTDYLNETAQSPITLNETNQTIQYNISELENSTQSSFNQTAENETNLTNSTISDPSNDTFLNESSTLNQTNQTNFINETESTNQIQNMTNSSDTQDISNITNSSLIFNETETQNEAETETGNQEEDYPQDFELPPVREQEEYEDVPESLVPVLSFMGTVSQHLSLPFSYIKNVVQITLLAFILHNLISFWVLASLYYFLPHTTHFLKTLLLLMWKAYNTELLGLFNVEIQLPKLNDTPSDLVYGQITISNDFLEFTFDPMIIMTLTAINILLIKAFKVCMKATCMQRKKLGWIKVDLMDDLSDIFIQLIPILFLPSANFIFSPHFQNPKQKINLILFSTFGSIGLVFPFWYFSLSINKTHSIKKNPKLAKKQALAQTQAYHKLFCNLLHITIPITVLLSNTWIFLISNAFFILLAFISAFRLKQQKINNIVHRFYYVIFHAGFCVMQYYKDGEQFMIAALVSFFTIFLYLLHEILEFVYRVGLFLFRFQRDCTQENKVRNQDGSEEESETNGHPLAQIQVKDNEICIGSVHFLSYNEFCRRKQKEEKIVLEDDKEQQSNKEGTMLPLNRVLTSLLQERRKRIHEKIHKTSHFEPSLQPLHLNKAHKVKKDRSDFQKNILKVQQPPQIINPEDILLTTYISK